MRSILPILLVIAMASPALAASVTQGGMSAAPLRLPSTDDGKPGPRKYRGPPVSLEEDRARARQRLKELEVMAPEEWRREQEYKRAQRITWDQLSTEQKEEVLRIHNVLNPPVQRLPEIPLPAEPVKP